MGKNVLSYKKSAEIRDLRRAILFSENAAYFRVSGVTMAESIV